jgi:excisionase family DNA binding protein
MTRWLSPKQAAEYASVDVVTLRRAAQRGTLKAYRIENGRLLRYRVEDLDAWLSLSPVEVTR